MFTTRQKSFIEIFLQTILIAVIIITLLAFMPTLIPVYRYASIGLGSIIFIANVWILVLRKENYMKLTRFVSIYFSVCTLSVFFIYYISSFMVLTDEYGMEEVLRNYGSIAKWIYFIICFAQPIILPIPEVITLGAGGAVFGSFQAASLGFLGTLSGILVMFFFAKFGGMKIVHRFVKEKHLKQYQAYVNKHETLIIGLLFIIPILPDEIICVGAGVSGVSIKRFVLIATLSKIITSLTLSYSVKLAGFLNLSTSELIFYITLILLVIFLLFLFFKKTVKKKEKSP